MPSLINSFWFALKNFTDTFNRTTSGNLGTSSGGQLWTALRGVWSANGTQGTSADNPTTYPIASYDIGTANTLSRIDSGPGTGVAFWITDANSWWAAYPFYDSTSSSVCDQSQVTGANNPPAGNCCSTVTSNTTYSCTGTQVTNTSNPPSASCCSSVTTNQGTAATCSAGLVTGSSNPPSGSCCGGVTTNTGYTYTPTTTTSGGGYCCAATSYTRSGTNPRTPTCADYPGCDCLEQYTAVYVCCNGLTRSSYSCYYPTTTSYTCPSGGTYNSTSGLCEVPTTYSCYTQYSGGTATTYSCYTTQVGTTTYSCYTANTTTTTYSSAIRIISSVSGTVTTDSTTVLGTSTSSNPTIGSIEVTTNGTTITAKGYTGTGQTTQLGSTITRTPSSPTTGTSIGIIKAPSTLGQSSTVDNYSVSVQEHNEYTI